MSKLKPCPFCGSKDVEFFQSGKDKLTIRCKACRMSYIQRWKFLGELKNGELDIFKPFAFGSEYFPKDLLGKSIDSKEFLHLGMEDHNKTDDVVKAKLTKIAGD